MKIIKVIAPFAVISLLLSSCNLPANTEPFQANPAKEKANSPAPINGSSKQDQKENPLRNLSYESAEKFPDGSYWFCTEPSSPQLPDERQKKIYVWCFRFRKNGTHVVGTYTYREPKDTAQICIDGTVKGNRVRGSGYEITEGGSEPVRLTQKDLTRMYGNGIWEQTRFSEKASNLRVNMPRLHSTGRYTGYGNRYYAWVKYDNITLNLGKFSYRELEDYVLPKKCPHY
jgi:hypothetical protein